MKKVIVFYSFNKIAQIIGNLNYSIFELVKFKSNNECEVVCWSHTNLALMR